MTATATTEPRNDQTPRRAKALTVGQVPTLSAAQIGRRIDARFKDLVTVAIADATFPLAPSVRRLLRSEPRLPEWLDALMWAEGELQVAAERMTVDHDPRLDITNGQLDAIRRRLDEARQLVSRRRRDTHQQSLPHRITVNAEATARKWLTDAFPGEFRSLLEAVLAERNLAQPDRECHRNIFDAVEHGHAHGWLDDEITPEVRHLLSVSENRMREVARADARDQDARCQALGHPLLLRRWHVALNQLAEQTYRQAGAASPHALGPTPPILLAPIDRDQARAVLKARRFLAAVLQRRIECGHLLREAAADLEHRKQNDPHRIAFAKAKAHARDLLAQEHPIAFTYIRDRLRDYENPRRPGVLDLDLLPDDHRRGQIKREVVTAARAASSVPGAPQGADGCSVANSRETRPTKCDRSAS
ncbi:hypothetical protein [Nocardia transvalensis]|uniref:hypothetical protein n=1 Tax=Nocardia transvalensis TaxID=37333 RepID=UPI001893AC52|nr:hypothetical protein [Nocardia transvalensis]MBF6333520.1 hypothetical protein [Nocardia transvalensis]